MGEGIIYQLNRYVRVNVFLCGLACSLEVEHTRNVKCLANYVKIIGFDDGLQYFIEKAAFLNKKKKGKNEIPGRIETRKNVIK